MGKPNTDTKPLSFIGKSEIAKKAETLEARTEARSEAQAQAEESREEIRIVYGTRGTYPDGTEWERDATPEEKEEYEQYGV